MKKSHNDQGVLVNCYLNTFALKILSLRQYLARRAHRAKCNNPNNFHIFCLPDSNINESSGFSHLKITLDLC